MPQLLQMLQGILIGLVPVVLFAIVFFLSKIKPIGEFFATLIHIPAIALRSLAQLLKPFSVQEKPPTSKYTGLRTILVIFTALYASLASVADAFINNQAIVAWTDDSSLSFTLPSSLSWLNYSSGWLFLSISAIAGIFLLDVYFHVVPEEVRIFKVPEEEKLKKRFERFILVTFLLSLIASVAFNALKPAYLFDSSDSSWYLWTLRFCVYIVVGALLPLLMACAGYLLGLGFQAILSIVLTISWFLANTLCRILGFLAYRFAPEESSVEIRTIEFYETDSVVVREVGTTQSGNGHIPGVDTPVVPLLPDQSVPMNGHAEPKPEKRGKRRTLKVELITVPVTPEQSSEQPKDTSKPDSVTKPKSKAKRKATTSLRKVKAPAPGTSDVPPASLNGRKKTTATK